MADDAAPQKEIANLVKSCWCTCLGTTATGAFFGLLVSLDCGGTSAVFTGAGIGLAVGAIFSGIAFAPIVFKAITRKPGGEIIAFWGCAWLGTMAGGAAFGLLLGVFADIESSHPVVALLLLGLGFGAIIAGVVSVPIIFTVAIFSWAFFLDRFRWLSAGACGLATAIVCAWPAIGREGQEKAVILLVSSFGALGAVIGGVLYDLKRLPASAQVSKARVWQFTVRDLFLRVTVLAVVIAAWSWVYDSYRIANLSDAHPHRGMLSAKH